MATYTNINYLRVYKSPLLNTSNIVVAWSGTYSYVDLFVCTDPSFPDDIASNVVTYAQYFSKKEAPNSTGGYDTYSIPISQVPTNFTIYFKLVPYYGVRIDKATAGTPIITSFVSSTTATSGDAYITDFSANVITPTSIRFQFTGNFPGGAKLLFSKYNTPSNSNLLLAGIAPPAQSTLLVENLLPDTSYNFVLYPIDALNNLGNATNNLLVATDYAPMITAITFTNYLTHKVTLCLQGNFHHLAIELANTPDSLQTTTWTPYATITVPSDANYLTSNFEFVIDDSNLGYPKLKNTTFRVWPFSDLMNRGPVSAAISTTAYWNTIS